MQTALKMNVNATSELEGGRRVLANRRELLVVGALTLSALLLRSISLNSQLWIDEYAARSISRMPLDVLLATYFSTNQHPLFNILSHFSLEVFGQAPWALRLPAMLFGTATIPALYFCARQIVSRNQATIACALIAVSYQHIWFSQNARGYTGMALSATLATAFFLRALKLEGKAAKRDWTLYGIAVALGIYTHLAMAFVLIAHMFVLLGIQCFNRRLAGKSTLSLGWRRGIVAAILLSFVLHMPMIGDIYKQTLQFKVKRVAKTLSGTARPAPVSNQVKPKRSWENPSWTVTETVQGLSRGINLPLLALALLVFLSGVYSFAKGDGREKLLLWLLLAPCLMTAIAMLVIWKAALPRFFFFAIGLGAIVMSRGIIVTAAAVAKALRTKPPVQRYISGAFAGLAVLISLLSLRTAYAHPKQDIIGAMEYVESNKKPNDRVVTIWPFDDTYQIIFGKSWRMANSAKQMEAFKPREQTVWTIYSLPRTMQSFRPAMWQVLQSDFEVVKVLLGTLGDGDVYICRSRIMSSSRVTHD